MDFFGNFIGEVSETDEFYSVKLLQDAMVNDINILCFISKKLKIKKEEIEQYIIDDKRVLINCILIKNNVIAKDSSEKPSFQAELQVNVYSIEDLEERCQRIREQLNDL